MKKKTLKVFLVKRFIAIVALLVMCEGFVNYALNTWLFPFFIETYQKEEMPTISFQGGNNITVTILMLLYFFLFFFFSLLPGSVGNVLKLGLRWVMEKLGIGVPAEQFIKSGMSGNEVYLYYLGMLFFALVCLFFILVPFVLAAILFSRLVMVKVDRPLKSLSSAMEQVRRGNISARAESETEYEFTELQDAFNDMAERMERDEERKKELEEKRNLMLSDIAHDLRTPITTIAGYAKALNDGMVTKEEKKREYLDAICRKSLRMNELINLLFEYVQLDSTGFTLKKETLDLGELIRENVALMYADFEEKHIELEIDIEEEPYITEVDKIQFSRMLSNLTSNALKHTEDGGKVLVSFKHYTKGMKLMVADNGEVIPKEIAAHIFEPFVSGDASRNSRQGTGLGLSISEKIAGMHGYVLRLEDMPGEEYTKSFSIYIL